MVKHIGFALLLLLTAAITAVIRAPAGWVGQWLESRTTFRLIDARGTVWHGSALLGVSDGRQTTLVPGRLEWQVDSSLLLWISHPWLRQPLEVSVAPRKKGFAKGTARVPAAMLAATGAPFNTLRPTGILEISWTDTVLGSAGLAGELQIDWRDAQSAISTVAPLGAYRLRLTGAGQRAMLELETLSGPLRMQGNGTWEAGRVRFNGVATAEPGMQGALNGLLGLLGRRAGDKVLLAFDN